MRIAESPANGQEQIGVVTEETGAMLQSYCHPATAHQGEVTPDKVVQLDKRLQAVEEAVSQLCTLHEQTLQLVVRLYDVMTAQKAKEIETVTAVLRKAQQYVAQIHERTPTSEPESSSCTCVLSITSS